MSASEGLRRIASVIRWLGYLAAGVYVFAAVFIERDNFLVMFGIAAGVAIVGKTLSWIIEGFAKPKA